MKKSRRILEYLIIISFTFILDIALMINIGYRINGFYYLLTFASLSIIPGIILLFNSSKVRFILDIIYIALVFIIFVTDSCLYYYKEDIFALGMLADVGDGLKMGIKYAIFIAFKWWEWLLIFMALIISIITLVKIMLNKNKTNEKIKFYHLSFILLSIVIFTFSPIIIKAEDKYIFDTSDDKRTNLLTFGMATFNTKNTFDTMIKLVSNKSIKNKAYKTLTNINKNDLNVHSNKNGSMSDKNVILIQMETVEEYCIDEILTPTLYKLIYGDNSYTFTNAFSVAKNNYTYDAEFKALTSMMYYNSDNYMHTYANNHFNQSLPNILKNNGYTANSFHAFSKDYFNRTEMHHALGFSHFYAQEEMQFSEVDFWQLDSEMVLQMKDRIIPIQDELFFSYIITLTTHGSYSQKRTELLDNYEKITLDGRFSNENGYSDEFITLLAAHIDLDKTLEILINDLKDKNLFDDTMIVLYSDHKNYSSPETTYDYSNFKKEDIEKYGKYIYNRIPMAIFNSNIIGKEYDNICSQYDIMPTILDLLGIDYIKDYYYGQSIFLYDTNQFVDKTIIFGYRRWISSSSIVYDTEIIWQNNNSSKLIIDIQEEVNKEINKFHSFFITDYFK